MERVHYYIIHNLQEHRREHMRCQLATGNINESHVTWITHPNKDEISRELIEEIVTPGVSLTCGKPIDAQATLRGGQISCTYKHYLALKNMLENGYEYAVIMEDNMKILGDVPTRLNTFIEQLDAKYPDWDIVFDNGWHETPVPYIEQPLVEGQIVYPKSNEFTNQCHGGTKCACFYFLNRKCAQKLFDNYLPFNNAPDWWMNDLFRKLNIKSFWAEPSNIGYWRHISTA
jgi:GR25 family glycosyltransferase involved in LPS biosynthesis